MAYVKHIKTTQPDLLQGLTKEAEKLAIIKGIRAEDPAGYNTFVAAWKEEHKDDASEASEGTTSPDGSRFTKANGFVPKTREAWHVARLLRDVVCLKHVDACALVHVFSFDSAVSIGDYGDDDFESSSLWTQAFKDRLGRSNTRLVIPPPAMDKIRTISWYFRHLKRISWKFDPIEILDNFDADWLKDARNIRRNEKEWTISSKDLMVRADFPVHDPKNSIITTIQMFDKFLKAETF
jgi:hypothetical protein